MYAARTKRVASYGKRAQRYVAVSDSRRFGGETIEDDPPVSNRHEWSPSPIKEKSTGVPTPAKKTFGKSSRKGIAKGDPNFTPVRRPLGVLHPSALNSPILPSKTAIHKKSRQVLGKGTPTSLRQFSPFVDVDIIIIDDAGHQISQERRVSKSRLQVNNGSAHYDEEEHPQTPSKTGRQDVARTYKMRTNAKEYNREEETSDDEYIPSPQAKKPSKPRHWNRKTKPIVVAKEQIPSTSSLQDSKDPPRSDSSFALPKPSKKAKRKVVITDESESDLDSNVINAPRPTAEPLVEGASAVPLADLEPECLSARSTSYSARPTLKAMTSPTRIINDSWHGNTQTHPDTVSRPLTPIKVKRSLKSTNAKPGPSRLSEYSYPGDDDNNSTSLDISIDLELELALKVAELDLSDVSATSHRTSLAKRASKGSKAPVITAEGLPPRNRSLLSSNLRPSLKKKVPPYLRPLLEECGQDAPYDFAEFVETFPFDPIHQSSGPQNSAAKLLPSYEKVGEASYSEVFGIGNVVLKIVPLLDDDDMGSDRITDLPTLSETKDVLKEIIVTRAMGDMCDGFIKLLRTHVVQGPYPAAFLDLWDLYNERKGSESVRPDSFADTQSFAIIILPNAGPDLELFSFNSASCWSQACSVFWQVVRSLANAEDVVHFEHRDLHWGQILVRHTDSSQRLGNLDGKFSMDDPSHGVQATIIDLGLARINYGHNEREDGVYWTPFDEETFEGEGDYQYDIYRLMRCHNADQWAQFRPLTNVMWLHYLADKLIHSKGLKAPSIRSRTKPLPLTRPKRGAKAVSTDKEVEKRAYECLLDIEAVLAEAVAIVSRQAGMKSFKRSKKSVRQAGEPKIAITCAESVLQHGQNQGWVV